MRVAPLGIRSAGAVLAAWIFAAPLTATAQPARRAAPAAQNADEARALQLFEQSVEEYRAGRFQQAADLLREAHRLHPEPTLLYNLARALEGLGDEAGAIEQYDLYLAAAPNAPDRGAIEQKVATLRRQIAEREALARAARETEPDPGSDPDAPVDPPDDVEETSSGGRGPWPWLVSGVGLAALGAGGALGAVALSRNAAADDAPKQTEAWSRYEGARDFATAANVCFIAGGVVLAAGVVWVILGGGGSDDASDEPADEDPEDEELSFGAEGLTLTF